MKTLLLSTVAVLALGGMANATDFVCSAPQFAVGQQSRDKQDTVDGIEIRHASNSPEWQVHHRFQNGTMVMREEQYAMTDASNPNGWAWRGRLKRNSSIFMVGELRRDYQGHPYYMETQYANGRVTMQTRSACNVVTMAVAAPGPYQPLPPVVQPTPQPPVVQAPPTPPPNPAPVVVPTPQPPIIIVPIPAPMPTATPPKPEPKAEPKPEPKPAPMVKRDSIPLNIQDNSMTLNVGLGDRTVSMLLDTGATTSVVTNAVAERLVRNGHARWTGEDRYVMADGSVKTVQTIVIYEMRIGNHVVRNARAGVTDSMLLGFSVLQDIGPFMIDTRNSELVFVTVEARDTSIQTDATEKRPTAAAEERPAPSKEFWPEGTSLSPDCAREIMKYKDAVTPDCKAEAERWATQLKKNLSNPAFKKQITDILK